MYYLLFKELVITGKRFKELNIWRGKKILVGLGDSIVKIVSVVEIFYSR